LVVDSNLYPRAKQDWFTAYKYAEAMKVPGGRAFPPILVGLYGDQYIVVDGAHRIWAAKTNKQTEIDAIVRYYSSDKDLYRDAVVANAFHGRQFSTQEKVVIINRLKDYDFASVEIAQMMGIQEIKMTGFVSTRMARSSQGMDVALKAPLTNLADTEISEQVESIQSGFTAGSQLQIVNEFLGLLNTGAVDISNKVLRTRLFDTYTQLKELISSNKKLFSKKQLKRNGK
jgi:hypothetical protein